MIRLLLEADKGMNIYRAAEQLVKAWRLDPRIVGLLFNGVTVYVGDRDPWYCEPEHLVDEYNRLAKERAT